jgi:2-dehydropantoate 2-reductase
MENISNSMAGEGRVGFRRAIVLGAGAIGSYYGALLSRRIEVLLVGRKEHVKAINAKGLSVSGAFEEKYGVRASMKLRDFISDGLVLLTTKAHESETAIMEVADLLNPGTVVLVLQNGLGNEALVRALVDPRIEVVRGLTSAGIEFLAPGEITVKLVGETILPNTETGERIRTLFESCGVKAILSDGIDVDIWRKLTMNCVINPLTTLFRVPNREIAADSLKDVRSRIVGECVEVARREGVRLNPHISEDITKSVASYSNLSSMCQDIIKGKRTEIDFINGKVAELGRKHGVETPMNDVMTALIKFMEGKSRR